MKDDNSRVLIDHFFEDVEPLGAAEKRALGEAPVVDESLKRDLLLGASDAHRRR